jgi:UDP-glucuronate decarboxylase
MNDEDIILRDVGVICSRVRLNDLDGKSILVTGSSGLIGTYFLYCLYYLCERGLNIKVYANMLSEPPTHMRKLLQNRSFHFIQSDLSDSSSFSHMPNEVDVIIHAAGYAQPIRFMDNLVATFQINTTATIALLQRLNSKGHFLFLSSSEVYSGLNSSSCSENDIGTTTPFHSRASYIEGKRGGETICNAFRTNGIHSVSVRLGDIYGPGTKKHDKRALNSFIEKALCHHKIELLDAGSAIRTYCYVADAVELMWDILLYGKEAVYNVGGRSAITILKLAETIGKLTSVPVIIPKICTEVTGAPKQLSLDLSRVENEFGKTTYVELEEGLQSTIEWQRQLYSERV